MTFALDVSSVAQAGDVPADDWNRLANPPGARLDPFVTHEFFHSLEESGAVSAATGWQPLHLLARQKNGDIAGILPLYLKGHSQGEYVFDHGWAQGFELAGGRYYPKLLSAVPFTPVTGRRLFVASGADGDAAGRALIDHALKLLAARGLSSLHINFIERGTAEWIGKWGPKGEAAGGVEPANAAEFLLRQGRQFHWLDQGYGDFEGFLASLQSRKRKALRKERRAALAPGIEIEWLEGAAISAENWDCFYGFYLDTGTRKWGRPYLNREFFELIGQVLKDHIVLMLARRGGEVIAGALHMKGSNTLYGRYWGARGYFPFLHFELCYYQAIDYALARGLCRVEAGAQGEHKLLRGYEPMPTYSAHYIAQPDFRDAVKRFLIDEGEEVRYVDDMLKTHLPFRAGDGNEQQ